MNVRNEKNESVESTPIGWPIPKVRWPVFWREAGCTLSHQKLQYSFQVVGMSVSLNPASASMSAQYWMCMVCCLIGNA